MQIQVERVEFKNVESLRGLFRQEANCQFVRDSMLSRGLADPYLVVADGRIAGYGGVLNKYDPGQLSEMYILPPYRVQSTEISAELLRVSEATEIQAQTNIPWMVTLLFDFATDIVAENILFADAATTNLTCPSAEFGPRPEPDSDYGVWIDGELVGSGGFLCHYNPPYGDIYMNVDESARRRGVGSFLVQELKRVCYEAGKRPAARCDVDNVASRRTLQRAGLLPCGRLLAGKVKR